MISHFCHKGLVVRPRAWTQESRAPTTVPESGSTAPLRLLLDRLRGRRVTLLIGGRSLAGWVVTVEPLLLCDKAGRISQVQMEQVASVSF